MKKIYRALALTGLLNFITPQQTNASLNLVDMLNDCELSGYVGIEKIFWNGRHYFLEADDLHADRKESAPEYYESALNCFETVLKDTKDDNLRRNSLYYSAMALWYGVKNKNPDESMKRFIAVVDYGIDDDKDEMAIAALGKMNFEYAGKRANFSLENASLWFKKLMARYPQSPYYRYASDGLNYIKKKLPKKQ